jgi:dUTP pyrophosphatase
MKVLVKKLHENARVPSFAKFGDAGADLYAVKSVRLLPMVPTVVPCGIAIELPYGYEAQIRPRSSSLMKQHTHVAFGTIDSGYRGEIGVAMVYLGTQDALWVQAGDRIAQLVIVELPTVAFEEAAELSDSERGESGWGSTGVR